MVIYFVRPTGRKKRIFDRSGPNFWVGYRSVPKRPAPTEIELDSFGDLQGSIEEG